MPKHTHRPSSDRTHTHRGLVYTCVVCGRSILFVAATASRQAYWRTF